MLKKILSTTVVAIIALSGCSATKAEVKKPEAKKSEVKVKAKKAVKETKTVTKKAVAKVGGASVIPSSEFFKTK